MDETYFDDARGMFLTAGWKTFMSEIEESIENYRIENIQDEVGFREAKGELKALHRIAGYENYVLHMESHNES